MHPKTESTTHHEQPTNTRTGETHGHAQAKTPELEHLENTPWRDQTATDKEGNDTNTQRVNYTADSRELDLRRTESITTPSEQETAGQHEDEKHRTKHKSV